jgi:hypothetical protein
VPLSVTRIDQPDYAPSYDSFKAVEDAKVVQVDADDPTKIVQIGAGINPK